MSRTVSINQHLAINFYETNKDVVEKLLVNDLIFHTAKEFYVLETDPIIRILGYLKVTESGFVPTEKELADLVEIMVTAEASEEPLK